MTKKAKQFLSTKSTIRSIAKRVAVVTLLMISFSGCTGLLLDTPSASMDSESSPANDEGSWSNSTDPVQVRASEFSLFWDAPADDPSPASYNVYYRTHGDADWNYLDSVAAAATPNFTVNDTMLSYGTYDFAVTSVSSGGVESELHTSLDANAVPTGGWYLQWSAP